MNQFRIDGKTAVITGGGSGLGLGIARVFIAAGAKVVIIGRNEDKLKTSQQELGDNACYRVFDISDKKNIPSLVEDIEHNVGQIDILVNCAGVHLKKPALDVTDEEYLNIINVHVLSVFAFTREVMKGMVKHKSGNIILISSMTAFMGMQQVVAYSTAKTAIMGLQRSLIADYSAYGIHVNTIAPGWIDTPMLHKAIDNDAPRREKILGRIPTHTFGDPDDIGNAALFLCSPAGKYINGVTLPVDAGAIEAF